MSNNILLTGCYGFIGRHICDYLIKKKYKVYCVVKKKRKDKLNKRVKIIKYTNNLNLYKKFRSIKINYIIHCATNYQKIDNPIKSQEIIDDNISFGIKLLDILKAKKIKKFINFTTVWENYNSQKNYPYNFYALSKNIFSKILDYYKRNSNDAHFYNLYLSNTFGYNDKRNKLMPKIKLSLNENKKIELNKNIKLNILNVKDVISGVDIILKKNIKSDNYNLVNNKLISIFDILKKDSHHNIEWVNKKFLEEKILIQKKIPGWKPVFSNKKDLINFIYDK